MNEPFNVLYKNIPIVVYVSPASGLFWIASQFPAAKVDNVRILQICIPPAGKNGLRVHTSILA
jgi:hypothetical protein